jgi:hypothetical protein
MLPHTVLERKYVDASRFPSSSPFEQNQRSRESQPAMDKGDFNFGSPRS